ncbi:MAG TPA: hypothetical protein PKV98_07750 [Burkholderiaceae bacterium]|nr:hypothetical protein [Burkholderiaceae bacterium]
MINFGAVPAGAVLPIMFNTYAGSTGASVTLTGLAVTDIEVYKGTSMTQRASDAGYTLLDTDGIDLDGVTGIHGFSIDTGDNTDASFYTVGSFFTVVVSAVTVDSQTVNFVAATFRIVAAEGVTGTPKADTSAWAGAAVASPAISGVPKVDVTHNAGTAITSASGVQEVKVASLATAATTAIRDKVIERTTCSGTVGSGSTTANVVSSAVAVGATTSLSADAWKGRVIIFNSDTSTAALRGQAAAIVSHDSGSTPTFTVATGSWTTAPLSGDTFTVV